MPREVLACWHKGASSTAVSVAKALGIGKDRNYNPGKFLNVKIIWLRHPFTIISSAVNYHLTSKEPWLSSRPGQKKFKKIHFPNPKGRTYREELKSRSKLEQYKFEMEHCSGVVIRNMVSTVRKYPNAIKWRVEDSGNNKKVGRAVRMMKRQCNSRVNPRRVKKLMRTRKNQGRTNDSSLPNKAIEYFYELFPEGTLAILGYSR